ncbi:MAG: MtrB/PioB family outer membrane beta-barrel protein [Planctomycetes bacterium]|nr:MtrB/PioB family outer membrane beta-barrel protein [Planctomycetota bacterium]MBI3847421.1 MtrB/PioB family outer membrane beta-barrel protein [Planctomycetota bacterium]
MTSIVAALLLTIVLDDPVPVATCSMCHALPAKRLEPTKHGYILADEDLQGCETCHGPGLAHVESEGDREKIHNPRKMGSDELDALCEKCHADVVGMRSGDTGVHATTQPCSSCHVVHNPGVEPRITKGGHDRGRIDETPLGTAAMSALAAAEVDGLERLDTTAWDTGIGLRLRGSLTAGARFVKVSGNDDVFDQDVNLDGGFRLLDATLHGVTTNPEAVFDRVDAQASGIDDPVSSYRLAFAKNHRWTWSSGFRKQNWVYDSSGDFHRPFDVKREETFTDVSVDASDRVKVYTGWDELRRSGEIVNTRFLEGAGVPVREPVDQTTNRVRVGATIDFGEFDVNVEEELRWFANDDSRLVLAGAPPQDTFLDYHTKRRDFTPISTVRFHSAPWDEKVDFSVRALYAHSDADTDLSQDRRSLGSPTTQDGSADATRNTAAIESALTVAVRDDLSLSTTGSYAETRERGSVHIDETAPGGPRRTFLDDTTSVFKRTIKGSSEALYSPIRGLNLRGGWEAEFEDVRIDTQDRPLTVDSGGPLVGVQTTPAKNLSIDALYRRAETDDPFTANGAETQDRLRTRVRWTSPDGWFVAPEWTRSSARNHDSDSRTDSTSLGASGGYARPDDFRVSASYFWRNYRTRTESTVTLEGVRVNEGEGFANREHRILLDGELDVTKPFRVEGNWELVVSGGDFPFVFHRFSVRPNLDLSWNWNVFFEVSFARFAETHSSDDDYDAFLYLLGATYRF